MKKPIPGFKTYDVDTEGVVTLRSTGEVICVRQGRSGELSVVICGNNWKHSSIKVCRAVLQAHATELGESTETYTARYVDGDKFNVRLSNLYWDKTTYTPEAPAVVMANKDKWHVIPEYTNYEINLYKCMVRKISTGNLVSFNRDSTGYWKANMFKDSVQELRSVGIFRVLALVLYPHPWDTDRLVVNHIDGNPDNNKWDNLEWTTYSDNISHAYSLGLRKEQIVILAKVLSLGTIVRFVSINEAARYFGVNPGAMSFALNDRKDMNKPYRGCILKYENDPTPWPTLEQIEAPRILKSRGVVWVKDIESGDVSKYKSYSEMCRVLDFPLTTITRILEEPIPIPYRGKLMQFEPESGIIEWPVYPKEIVKLFSEVRNTARPLKVTDTLTGNVEFISGVTDWCKKTNLIDPAVLSRYLKNSNMFRSWKFEHITLTDYATYPEQCMDDLD